ncbi:DUF202 domain-containing protein [Streptomyces sp. AK02-01A]|uniref:DUF202 domain-containing protein n=1 Tax=Streptomyces sp. AK02-01A TaxID=3028648 RepID=UPI0029BE8FD0|nr:DUF202 domain-containing protein [Streptomyces sp. AK02-01A]MDX3850554.1 DUF202 domain-containing protein [Streptomyces sp. AK02-01A]
MTAAAGRDPDHEGGPRAEEDADAGHSRDPGLQPERTWLAWRRTTLSLTVVTLLAARQAVHTGGTAAGVVACALSALVWLGFLAVAQRRALALAAVRPRPLSPRAAAATAGCTVLLALFAVAVLV